VDHRQKQQGVSNRADRVPAWLARLDPFQEDQAIGIFEDERRGIEGEGVLSEVAFVFPVIPFESHNRRDSAGSSICQVNGGMPFVLDCRVPLVA